MRKWSPDGLYRHEFSTPHEVWFRYPSRLDAGVLLVLIALTLTATAWWGILDGDPSPVFLVLGVLFALGMGTAMTLRIWDQRAIRFDSAGRRVTYFRRTLFRDSEESLPYDAFAEVLVTLAPQSDSEGAKDRSFDVFLKTPSDLRILMGRTGRDGAVHAGRRYAAILDVPLRLPSP